MNFECPGIFPRSANKTTGVFIKSEWYEDCEDFQDLEDSRGISKFAGIKVEHTKTENIKAENFEDDLQKNINVKLEYDESFKSDFQDLKVNVIFCLSAK